MLRASNSIYISAQTNPGPTDTWVWSSETTISLRFLKSMVTPPAILDAPAKEACPPLLTANWQLRALRTCSVAETVQDSRVSRPSLRSIWTCFWSCEACLVFVISHSSRNRAKPRIRTIFCTAWGYTTGWLDGGLLDRPVYSFKCIDRAFRVRDLGWEEDGQFHTLLFLYSVSIFGGKMEDMIGVHIPRHGSWRLERRHSD